MRRPTIISRYGPGDRARTLAGNGEGGISTAGCSARSFWWDTYRLSGPLNDLSAINL